MVRDGKTILLLPPFQILFHETRTEIDEPVADGTVKPMAMLCLLLGAAVVALGAMVGAVQDKAVEIPPLLQVVEASVDRGLVTIHIRVLQQR
jgi:hypothetical protein